MSDDQLNQTQFLISEHSPEPVVSPQVHTETKKPPMLLYLGLAIAVLFVVSLVIAYALLRAKKPDEGTIATPVPSAEPLETSAIRGEIAPYLQQIEVSNPENDEHPFPPVDFTVRIKDPNQSR